MNTVNLKVITPEATFIDTEVSFVVLPGYSGELGVMPGHMKYLAQLVPGMIRYTNADGSGKNINIGAGVVWIKPKGIKVYTALARYADK